MDKPPAGFRFRYDPAPCGAFRRFVFSRNLFLHAASSDLAWSRSNAQSHNSFSCIFPECPRLPVICSPAATVWIFDLTFLCFPYPVWYRIFLCPSIRQKSRWLWLRSRTAYHFIQLPQNSDRLFHPPLRHNFFAPAAWR